MSSKEAPEPGLLDSEMVPADAWTTMILGSVVAVQITHRHTGYKKSNADDQVALTFIRSPKVWVYD